MPLQLVKYQEQGNLLDPHLERIVEPLSGVLRDIAQQAEAGKEVCAEALRGTCQLLWTVVTVRWRFHAICCCSFSGASAYALGAVNSSFVPLQGLQECCEILSS